MGPREVVTVKVMRDNGAYMPQKAHESDAGFDIRSRDTIVIPAGGSAFFDTGVHVGIPHGYVGFLKAKSGLNCKHNIVGTGVIDSGYTGSIGVKLYNHGAEDYGVVAGDKIIQLVLLPIPPVVLEPVEALEDSERGDGGFGSTGR